MNKATLKAAAGINFNILTKMGRDEFVSLESLYKICNALGCKIGDVMEFTEYE